MILWSVPSLFGLLGLTFLIIGLRNRTEGRRFRAGSASVSGIVDRLDYNARGMAAPVVRYSSGDTVHELRGTLYALPPRYRPGQAVQVLLRPEAPDNARIDSPEETTRGAGLLLTVGLTFLAVACIASAFLGLVMLFGGGREAPEARPVTGRAIMDEQPLRLHG
jgi:hypothetical protein